MTIFDHITHEAKPPRRSARTPALLLLVLASLALVRALTVNAAGVPAKLSDAAFWEMVSTFSEADGSFPANNFVSNETAFQTVMPRLTTRIKPGTVYVGVGPDQNFTYLVGLQPSIAFIVDIRRQNLVHQLMYKALIELSPDRETFLERLFSRPERRGGTADGPVAHPERAPIETLLAAVAAREPDEAAFGVNLRDIYACLEQVHGFPLTPTDKRTLEQVYAAFVEFGPAITYAPMRQSFNNAYRIASPFPSYADLMSERDGEGVNRAYLATEALYAALRRMQLHNLIVPVVGDFAGPKALRAVGDWVRDRDAVVTTFYTSNVEQYLFQNGVWRDYYDNVASMPTDGTSTFIRSYFPRGAMVPGGARIVIVPGAGGSPTLISPPRPVGAPRFLESSSLLHLVHDLLVQVKDGTIASYAELIEASR